MMGMFLDVGDVFGCFWMLGMFLGVGDVFSMFWMFFDVVDVFRLFFAQDCETASLIRAHLFFRPGTHLEHFFDGWIILIQDFFTP